MRTFSCGDRRRHGGFTLIELLVVISIIALLSTLTLVGVKTARNMINDVSTTNRIESVHTGLSQLGAGTSDTTAFIVQRDLGLKGVLTFRPSMARALNSDEWVVSNQVVSQSAAGATLSGSYGSTTITMSGQSVPEGTAEKDRTTYINPSTNTSVSGKITWVDYWTNRKQAGGPPEDPGKNVTPRYAWLTENDYAYSGIGSYQSSTKLGQGTYPYMPFPWGKARPTELLSKNQKASQANVVDEFMLRWCDVQKTRELLWLAGLVSPDFTANTAAKQYASYMTDRSKKATWNDAWGNPLVVAYALYQPPKNGTVFNKNDETTFVIPAMGTAAKYTNDMTSYGSVAVTGIGSFSAYINRQDHILNICQKRYQTTRQLYVTVAAAGLTIPEIDADKLISATETDWTGTSGILYTIWKRVAIGNPDGGVKPVCQQGVWQAISGSNTTKAWIYDPTKPEQGKGEWRSVSWDSPPWSGVNKQSYMDPTTNVKYRCFLSAPQAFQ